MAQGYDVIVDTPKYHRQGKLLLTPDGELMNARLEVTDGPTIEAQGKREGKDIDFAGKTEINGETVEFSGIANTWANSFNMTAQTSLGEVTIYGTSTGYSAGDVVGNDAGFAGRWADVG